MSRYYLADTLVYVVIYLHVSSVEPWATSFTLRYSLFKCVSEFLALNSGGSLCTNQPRLSNINNYLLASKSGREMTELDYK